VIDFSEVLGLARGMCAEYLEAQNAPYDRIAFVDDNRRDLVTGENVSGNIRNHHYYGVTKPPGHVNVLHVNAHDYGPHFRIHVGRWWGRQHEPEYRKLVCEEFVALLEQGHAITKDGELPKFMEWPTDYNFNAAHKRVFVPRQGVEVRVGVSAGVYEEEYYWPRVNQRDFLYSLVERLRADRVQKMVYGIFPWVPEDNLLFHDQMELLIHGLIGIGHTAGEWLASFDKFRADWSDVILRRWAATGLNAHIEHREVLNWYCDHRGLDRKHRFGTDPILRWLLTFAVKQGAPGGRSPWALREATKERLRELGYASPEKKVQNRVVRRSRKAGKRYV
jgi:hypothetical protein